MRRTKTITQASLKKLSDRTLKRNIKELNEVIDKYQVYGVRDVQLREMMTREAIRRKLNLIDL